MFFFREETVFFCFIFFILFSSFLFCFFIPSHLIEILNPYIVFGFFSIVGGKGGIRKCRKMGGGGGQNCILSRN